MKNQSHIKNINKSQQETTKQQCFSQCDIVKVMTGLYISDKQASRNKKLLVDLQISHIVTAGHQLELAHPYHFNYLHIPVKDHRKQPISDHFQNSNKFIEQALKKKQAVLVHCAFGKSRSATLIIAYLMFKHNMQFQQALNFLKRKRSEVQPNEGFMLQLKRYQQFLIKNKNKQFNNKQ